MLNTSQYFKEAGIPYSRLHDTEYPYGSGHFVDVPCIFKDFDRDPADPSSYDFALTDLYIQAICDCGTQVFYRLGVSIEHAPLKRNVYAPKDAQKWARICEGIIRHYNEGWANGFHYNIQYWEIWNEPEGEGTWRKAMWVGSNEEYFNLYATTAKHLKSCFPYIKVAATPVADFMEHSAKIPRRTNASFWNLPTIFLLISRLRKFKRPWISFPGTSIPGICTCTNRLPGTPAGCCKNIIWKAQ